MHSKIYFYYQAHQHKIPNNPRTFTIIVFTCVEPLRTIHKCQLSFPLQFEYKNSPTRTCMHIYVYVFVLHEIADSKFMNALLFTFV